MGQGITKHQEAISCQDQAVLEYLRGTRVASRCPMDVGEGMRGSPSRKSVRNDLHKLVVFSPPYFNLPRSRDPEDSPKVRKVSHASGIRQRGVLAYGLPNADIVKKVDMTRSARMALFNVLPMCNRTRSTNISRK